jgi:DnaD/phage-associated family protein
MSTFIYVCSPYGGLEENYNRAREYGQAVAKEGYIPIIPHVMWHGIFNDSIKEQREAAIKAGLALLKNCDQLRVFGKDITPGMSEEINFARANGIPVVEGKVVPVSDIGDLYRFFESNMMYLNRTVIDVLNDYIEQGLSCELIKEAIKITAKKNAGISYMEAILNRWVRDMIFTTEGLNKKSVPGCRQNNQSEYAGYDLKDINKILESD